MNENVYFATSYNRKDGRTRVIVMEKSLLSVMDFVTGDEYGWVEEDSASHAILWSVSLGATCLHFTGIIGVFSLASKGFIPYEVLGKGQDAKLCFDDLAVPLHHGVVAPLSDASYVKVNYHLEWWNVLHDAKIRVVTVHGFNGSPKNKAYREISRILPNAEVIGLEYEDWLDSSGIEKTLEALAPDLIIGNSLGGFYTLCYKGNCRRIVINPCLQPSIEIPKLDASVPAEVVEDWYKREGILYEGGRKPSERKNYFGIFAKDDELFHYMREFSILYEEGHNCIMVDGRHSLDNPGLEEGLIVALGYFWGDQSKVTGDNECVPF